MKKIKVKTLIEKVKDLKYNAKFNKFCMYVAVGFLSTLILTQTVYAADKVDTLTKTIAEYAKKGGGIVTLFGALQTAMGFKQDDPEAKTKGVRTAIAGSAVYAVATGYTTWIN